MQKTRQKQSQYHPDPQRVDNLQIQERDLAVVKQVMEDRFLTAQQISRLFFPSYEMGKKRLQKLWNAGYLKREFAPVSFGSSPAVYCLTAKGCGLLLEHGAVKSEEITWHKDRNRGGSLFKNHEIAVNDVKVALLAAARGAGETGVYEFGKGKPYFDRVSNSNPEAGEKDYIPIRPDGFIILQRSGGYEYFFLEVDRGTMTMKRIRAKLKGYRSYYFDGGFFEKYGQSGYRKEDYSFRVLMTCPTEETRNNRLEQACAIGSHTLCWFGVHDEVVNDPFGQVWVRGKEYKDALKSVPPEKEYQWMRSKNKSERDLFIREQVQAQTLLD